MASSIDKIRSPGDSPSERLIRVRTLLNRLGEQPDKRASSCRNTEVIASQIELFQVRTLLSRGVSLA